MRVCLVNPFIDISETGYREDYPITPPIGLAYLAGVLSERGHEVAMVDATSACPLPAEPRPGGLVRLGTGADGVISRIVDFAPDLVGISCSYTVHAPQSYEVARLVADRYSEDIPIIVGGPHVSVLPQDALDNPEIDYVAVGEGEGTIADLCAALESGAPTVGIPGLLQRDGSGGVAGEPSRARIKDLDAVPFPRRDLLPLSGYVGRQRLFHPRDINNRRIPKTTILTSRGCPGNCAFCAVRCTWGTAWTSRSPENVMAEIESLVNDFGIRELDFIDNSLTASRKRAKRLFELLIERDFDLLWSTPNGVAIWTLDHELLDLMKKAGCYRITFGFETGDPETLAFIRKEYSPDQARDIVRHCNRIGMWTVGTFMIGFPHEGESHIRNTIDFAGSLGLDLAMFYSASPYAGTDLHRACVEKGIDTTIRPRRRGYDTIHLSADEVESFRAMASIEFVRGLARRPFKPLQKIRSLDDLRYTWRVIKQSVRMVLGRSEEARLRWYPNFKR